MRRGEKSLGRAWQEDLWSVPPCQPSLYSCQASGHTDLGSQDSLSWVERAPPHPQGGNTLFPRNVGLLAVKDQLLLGLMMLQNTTSTRGLQRGLYYNCFSPAALSKGPLEQGKDDNGDDPHLQLCKLSFLESEDQGSAAIVGPNLASPGWHRYQRP